MVVCRVALVLVVPAVLVVPQVPQVFYILVGSQDTIMELFNNIHIQLEMLLVLEELEVLVELVVLALMALTAQLQMVALVALAAPAVLVVLVELPMAVALLDGTIQLEQFAIPILQVI